MASRKVSFKVYDIEKDAAAAKRMQQLSSGRGVPFAIINGIEIPGWSEKLYEMALEK